MTMPNPVAEVVERLDVLQEIDAAIEDAQAGQMEHDIIVTLQLAKAEIERLSRERDTGVPEGFWLAPNEPTREMEHAYIKAYDAICAVSDQYDDPFKWFEAGYNAVRAAAPQPPTVSEVASSDLPDEIYVERDAETNEKRWFSCKGMGEKYVHARLLYNWKFVAKHGLAKVTPEHTWAQWLAEMKADLSTLTRERDQAREALQTIVHAYDNNGVEMNSPEIGGHDDIPPHPWHEEWLQRARSVLHPDTEVSS